MTAESLSALLDGECTPAELDRLLDQMEVDPSLKARYSRMTLAREARLNTRVRSAEIDFSAAVMAALDTEPVAAPGASAGDNNSFSMTPAAAGTSNVLPFRPRMPTSWQPYAGLALAASLGAVAVLAIRPQSTVLPEAMPVSTQLAPVETLPAEAYEVTERRWPRSDEDNAEQLNNYLIAYSQSRAQQGMGSTLGYARFAAHTAEYRPQRIQGPKAQQDDKR